MGHVQRVCCVSHLRPALSCAARSSKYTWKRRVGEGNSEVWAANTAPHPTSTGAHARLSPPTGAGYRQHVCVALGGTVAPTALVGVLSRRTTEASRWCASSPNAGDIEPEQKHGVPPSNADARLPVRLTPPRAHAGVSQHTALGTVRAWNSMCVLLSGLSLRRSDLRPLTRPQAHSAAQQPVRRTAWVHVRGGA